MVKYDSIEVAKQFCAGVDHIRRSWTVWKEITDGIGWLSRPLRRPETIEDVMRATCPIVYATLQNALILDALFAIGRMTDPPVMLKNKEQLSAERVIDDLPGSSVEKVTAQGLLDSMSVQLEELREDRNKVVAHADLETSLGLTKPKEQRVETVDRVITVLHSIGQLLEQHYGQSWHLNVAEIGTDAESLRKRLRGT